MSTTPNPSPGRSSTGRGYQGRGGRGSGRGGRGGSPDRGAGRGRFQHATEQVVGANQSSNQSNQSVYSGPRTPNAPNPSGPNPSGPNGSASTPRKGSFSEFVKQKVLPKRGQRDKAPCAYQERTPPGAGRPPRAMPKCRNGDGCSNAKCQFIHSEFWDPNNASNVRKNPRPPRPSLKAAATAVVAARPSTTRGKTGVPVLNVDIDVGAEKKGTIVVKIGDDPLRLAVEFCSTPSFNLNVPPPPSDKVKGISEAVAGNSYVKAVRDHIMQFVAVDVITNKNGKSYQLVTGKKVKGEQGAKAQVDAVPVQVQKPEAETPEAEKPEAEKPEAEKPEAEKPEAEKPVAPKKAAKETKKKISPQPTITTSVAPPAPPAATAATTIPEHKRGFSQVSPSPTIAEKKQKPSSTPLKKNEKKKGEKKEAKKGEKKGGKGLPSTLPVEKGSGGGGGMLGLIAGVAAVAIVGFLVMKKRK